MNQPAKVIAQIFVSISLALSLVCSANALIVDINSLTNNESHPVSVFFDAGTYDVTPVGIADGGAYNSWNAWYAWFPTAVGCDGDGANCTYGWLNYYHIYSPEFGEIFTSDGIIRYENSLLALEHAVSTSFTLTSAAYVDFYIRDGVNGDLASDNAGGMSLRIGTPVPEPSTRFLMMFGLLALISMVKMRGCHNE